MIFAAATNNAKKLKEIKRILSALGHDAKTLRELGIEIEIEENGTTFAENAVIKAKAIEQNTLSGSRLTGVDMSHDTDIPSVLKRILSCH